ncbi:MAG: magnesium-translocating P-type ATPase [Candidatus Daviesbacteria bacterium]|nr:magnesium-translocating P-type ATPase [Candidatus Daviesbacteria bacterium]
MPKSPQQPWQLTKEEVFESFQTSEDGLSPEEVTKGHKQWGLNTIRNHSLNPLQILLRQLTSNPLIIILTATTIIALLLGEKVSSYYIFGIILASIILGFWNEYFAARAIVKLLKKVSLSALVIRKGEKMDIPNDQITVGDIVLLAPGSIVPADLRLIFTANLEIDESTLTGESIPVEKQENPLASNHLNQTNMTNIAFMGTTVRAGSSRGVVIAVGKNSEFGKIATDTSYVKPETSFQKGLAKYGGLLTWIMIITSLTSFTANVILGKNLLDAVLFSLAIAVGLTPELLPVLVTVALAHGADKLAKKEVLVKQLIAIENLGNIDILCTDKTGTLTEGKITVADYLNVKGMKDENVLRLGLICNTALVHHKIIGTPYDTALWEYVQTNHAKLVIKANKVFEEPFDYSKRLMFTVIEEGGTRTLIAKGAPEVIFNLVGSHQTLQKKYENLSSLGYNVIAIASKKINNKKEYSFDDVDHLDFEGFITFSDPAKTSAKEALDQLQNLNVQIIILTGDNELVSAKICKDIGLDVGKIIQGEAIDTLSEAEFKNLTSKTTVFCRVTPEQKLKIIQTLQKMGHSVGFMGDGINDVLALHSADVGICVNSAIDVAKDTAQVVLLCKDLKTVLNGIAEGRKVFSNTMKYILTYTGSNFGEMISLAGASFFMPFLPITPSQLLLQDTLYDISQMTITSDNVDPESVIKPKHWDLGFIKNYMIFFGVLSALFVGITFLFLGTVLHATPQHFQTGIFLEFMISEMIVVFVIRTNRVPFYKSKPGGWLLGTCFLITVFSIYLPYSPLASSLGFAPLHPIFFLFLFCLSLAYIVITEAGKKILLKRLNI